MNDNQIILSLLQMMLSDDLQIRQWLYGYNTHFDMSPDEMMKKGRSDEVIGYLVWAVYGPF